MFGYVKPYTPELKMIENQYYRATYCGLCRAMRDETGVISRMMLSYDVTFLVLLRLALTGERPTFSKKRCFLHPFRKRLVMESCNAVSYSAHVGTILTMHKISDDIADEGGLKRIGALILRLLFSASYKRAKKGYEQLDRTVKEGLEALNKLEREKIRSADRPSRIFGALMASVVSYGIDDKEKNLIASSVGMAAGRFIYLADALDDIEKDRKKRTYNPFLLLFESEVLDAQKKLDIEGAMMGVISRARDAIDLVDFEGRRDLEGLIRNILDFGLPKITKNLLFPEKAENDIFFENGDNK